MTKIRALLGVLLLAGALPLAACHKEGPAEKVGKSLDNAGQSVKDAVDPPTPLQKVGRSIDNATDN
jgi:hypothetical protein